MTLKVPGQRSLERLIKRVNREDALRGCMRHDPRRIYGGLLHHSRERRWKDGWAYYKFIAIYGFKPRPEDRGPPMPPPTELEDWISLLPKRSK